MKPEPLTTSVKLGPPGAAEFGVRLTIEGPGLPISRLTVLETPPPGGGVKTVTCAVPGAATSAAVSWAVTCVPETKAVGRSWPLSLTTDPCVKFAPVTVRVSGPVAAATGLGLRLVTDGAGEAPPETVKVSALDGPPPGCGLTTVTLA